MTEKHPFKVIKGGKSEVFINGVGIGEVPEPPSTVDAIVVEEDTFFVLSTEPIVKPISQHPIRVFTELVHCESARPGEVRVHPSTRPFRVDVVVYDVSENPMTRPDWVGLAIEHLVQTVERRQWKAIASPPLGLRHGGFALPRFRNILEGRLNKMNPTCLKHWWILV